MVHSTSFQFPFYSFSKTKNKIADMLRFVIVIYNLNKIPLLLCFEGDKKKEIGKQKETHKPES